MTTFHFRFTSDTEHGTVGTVDASDMQQAAYKVLTEDIKGIPRWKEAGISDKVLHRIPTDSDLVDISSSAQRYSLDLRMDGTRKRKPVRVVDVWTR